MTDLIAKLSTEDYYREFFEYVYGDESITEERIQNALAQFIRSIQSFDSKFDKGRATAPSDRANFDNFTDDENAGKLLFLAPTKFSSDGVRTAGGANCGSCHRAPEFDIDPISRNNGTTGVIGGGTDLTVIRSPSLRDIVNQAGNVNGLLMHNGRFGALQGVIAHYNNIPSNNDNLDNRLRPGDNLQNLNLSATEKSQIVEFLKTLTGRDVYTNQKWSNPFE